MTWDELALAGIAVGFGYAAVSLHATAALLGGGAGLLVGILAIRDKR